MLPVLGVPYYANLHLAAELGKNLLERNQALESQLQQMTNIHHEEKLEIDLLQKQLDVLKNVNESRLHMYEDIDRSAQDLERLNKQLVKEKKHDKCAISRLNETIQKLEERCSELENSLEEYAAKISASPNKLSRKRINSVPSLNKMYMDYTNTEFSGIPSNYCDDDEVGRLFERQQQTIKRLEMQLTIEKNKKKQVESELNSVLQEEKLVEEKFVKEINTLEAELTASKRSGKNNEENSCSEQKAHRPSQLLKGNDLLIECDIDSLPHGRLIRLKNGGSAFGSRESLHMIGLEADEDVTPSIEVCSAILASDMGYRLREEKVREQREASGLSLLAELEEQYRSLVARYEALLRAKQKSNQTDRSTQDNLDNFQSQKKLMNRKHSLDLLSPADPTEGHFETGPPEYKRLFKEIFQTLRKSILSEDDFM